MSSGRKAFYMSIPLLLVGGGILALIVFRHEALALCKCAKGTAKMLEKSIPLKTIVNDVELKAKLYPIAKNRLLTVDGMEMESPCYLLVIKDGNDGIYLKIGWNWIGKFSYGGGNLVEIGRVVIISDVAEKTYDIKDSVKGCGDDYTVNDSDGKRLYKVTLKDGKTVSFSLDKSLTAFIDKSICTTH